MKTCLVIGAGATLANALHFRGERMRDARPPLDTTFFDVVEARKIPLGASLQRYFREVLSLDETGDSLRGMRMEQIFGRRVL